MAIETSSTLPLVKILTYSFGPLKGNCFSTCEVALVNGPSRLIRVTVIATGFERRNPAVGARGASRPSYNNSYAQQHSSEKQQAAAPAQPGQAPSYGSGVIKPPTSDTEIPPWIRG